MMKIDLEIIQRFKKWHQIRIQSIHDALLPKQQIFLDILALIFHQNSPLLPGFNAEDTPCGVTNYVLTPQTLQAARSYTKTSHFKIIKPRALAIEAIFLLTAGTGLAFTKNTELIVWIFHITALSAQQLAALQLKAQKITQWGESLGLVVQCCLVDSGAWLAGKAQPFSPEQQGNNRQSALLREEFYRTALYMAGKVPIWWLTVPQDESKYHDYVAYVKEAAFDSQEFMDFGALERISAPELASALLENLIKTLYTPYQALPRLMLLISYAIEYPHPTWLCEQLKTAIYDRYLTLDDFHALLLICRQLESYCQRRPGLLLLVRKCLMMNLALIVTSMGATLKKHQVSPSLQQVAELMEWPEHLVTTLKSYKLWNIDKAVEDHEMIRSFLLKSLTDLQMFIKQHLQGTHNAADFDFICGQLRAFLNAKPNQVDIMNTQTGIRSLEDELSLVEVKTAGGTAEWLLFSGSVNRRNQAEYKPIKHADSLFSIWVWLAANHLYHKRLSFNIDSLSENLAAQEYPIIFRHLQALLKNDRYTISRNLKLYRTTQSGLVSMAFINFGHLVSPEHQKGKHLFKLQSDALNYGVNRNCLVQRIESVTLSEWGEISTACYDGVEGLLGYLTDVLNALKKPLRLEQLQLACYTPLHANTIQHRLHRLFKQLCDAFQSTQQVQTIRYFLEVGGGYYCIQYHEQVFSYWGVASKTQLIKLLGQPQVHFSQAVFDAEFGLKSLVTKLYKFNEPNKIQLFYLRTARHINIYLLDEKGAFFKQQYPLQNPDVILKSYAMLLEQVLSSYLTERSISLAYYELKWTTAQNLSCQSIQPNVVKAETQLPIHLQVAQSESKALHYTIICNKQLFSTAQLGKEVFKKAAHYLAQWRLHYPGQPIYMSSIKAPLSTLGVEDISQLQSIHFLHFRQKMASRLLF